MGMPSMPELLIVLAIVVLLFGAKKIPDLAKGMGKGIKDFKKAIKEESLKRLLLKMLMQLKQKLKKRKAKTLKKLHYSL